MWTIITLASLLLIFGGAFVCFAEGMADTMADPTTQNASGIAAIVGIVGIVVSVVHGLIVLAHWLF